MKRIVLQLVVVTLLTLGGVCGSANAQYPNHGHRNYVVTPNVVVYGGNAGYSNGFGAAYGAYGNNFGGYGGAYNGGYYGFAPVAPLYPRTAPYGAGYSGGYQPYQEMYLQRLYYGLGF